MPPSALRRALAMALLVAAAVVNPACERKPEGAVKAVVIGETPKVVDPAAGPLSAGEAVLLTNVAQGLVRFDARGQIEPGLAERWNVSNDGLSYIFRLASGEWPGGRKITAHQAARILRRTLAGSSNNALKDTLGAVDEIVAMTDRVLEIRLRAPRPNLLQLLAQPEFALVRESEGSGPFRIADGPGPAVADHPTGGGAHRRHPVRRGPARHARRYGDVDPGAEGVQGRDRASSGVDSALDRSRRQPLHQRAPGRAIEGQNQDPLRPDALLDPAEDALDDRLRLPRARRCDHPDRARAAFDHTQLMLVRRH